MKAIGIDIGTTSICGIVIDLDTGDIIKSRTENSNAFLSGSAEWEKIQSVEKIIGRSTEILDSLIEKGVVSIGVSGQMHGMVYIDSRGNALSPLYTWQDGRGNLPYKDATYASFLGSFSGYGNVTDFYNRENGIRPKNAVSYCTIHDYFVMRLCGLEKPQIHASNAQSFGLYDIEKNCFSYDFSPETVNEYKIAGRYKNIPVSVAIGDNQASVFSTLASDGDILINVGTGSQVSVISDTPIRAENIETRPYFEGKYLIVGSALCGGRAYSVLKSFYTQVFGYVTSVNDDTVYDIMDKMLESEVSSSLSVDTRFAGTRSNPSLSGCISGINTENLTPENLTRGVLAGMTEELYEMYGKMGVTRRKIVGSGNGIRKNRHLINAIEKTFGKKLIIPRHLEEAAFGAALFALISCGKYKNAKEAQNIIKYL